MHADNSLSLAYGFRSPIIVNVALFAFFIDFTRCTDPPS